MREPNPDHPITIAPHPGRVRVLVGGVVVAESAEALALREADYPPVLYLPRADVAMAMLAPAARTTHCPYKGRASYFDIAAGGERRPEAVWSYEAPYPAVAGIAGRLAFYPDRVDAIETEVPPA